MDVSIFIETTFDDGETKRRNIGRLRRAPDEFGSENLGLLLDDAKTLLRRLQEAIVQDQVLPAKPQLWLSHDFRMKNIGVKKWTMWCFSVCCSMQAVKHHIHQLP